MHANVVGGYPLPTSEIPPLLDLPLKTIAVTNLLHEIVKLNNLCNSDLIVTRVNYSKHKEEQMHFCAQSFLNRKTLKDAVYLKHSDCNA